MQFGFGAPVSGPLSTPEKLAQIAVEGEAMGYDYATISDHVVIPRDIEARYPYSDTGEFPGRSRGDRHEQLTAVAFVAGRTSRLRLVTSVTGVPPSPGGGAVPDESLTACRELWTKDAPRFDGRYIKFANILFEPKPVQK